MTSAVMRTVGRYELLREIGRGGMAVVYLARQSDLDRNVALKELSALHAADPRRVDRFLRESRLAGSLSHPNVVTVHEYFEHEGTAYIAMEHFERGSLRPRARRLTLAQTAGVLEGVLAGLATAHGSGIVHRDLKPENVMVTADGGVKITDFGIAKALETLGDRVATDTGVTVGTPAYMAPEQARGEDVGPWTDLYAVGVMAYEMVSGTLPFPETDQPLVMMLQHVSEPAVPLASVTPDVNPELAGWVERLLVKDTRKRPADAVEARDDLEEILIRVLGPRWRRDSRLVEDALEPAPKVPVRRETRRRRNWAAAAAVLALLVAGGILAGFALTGGNGTPPDASPARSERSALAVSGSSVYLADPRGRIVELAGASLRRQAVVKDTGPLTVVAARGRAYVGDDAGLKQIGPSGVVGNTAMSGIVAAAGDDDSPLVVATARRLCEIGPEGRRGPCGDIGFRAVALGSSPTGAIFAADEHGAVAVYSLRGDRLVYSATAALNLPRPHGTLVSSRGRLYVPIERGVAVVDPLNRRLLRVIHLPVTPSAIWVGRFSGQLFAALYAQDRLAIVDTLRDAAPRLLPGYSRPVAVWGSEGDAYVYGAGDRTLCRLDALTGARLGCREVPDA